MENGQHQFCELFAQLGLPTSEEDIRKFIAEHMLPGDTRLPDAEFWTHTQAEFLREAWKADADWAPIIDQLNNSLHH
jgi:hypothetical protein